MRQKATGIACAVASPAQASCWRMFDQDIDPVHPPSGGTRDPKNGDIAERGPELRFRAGRPGGEVATGKWRTDSCRLLVNLLNSGCKQPSRFLRTAGEVAGSPTRDADALRRRAC